MEVIINILLGICVVWTIVSVLFLLFLNRPSVKSISAIILQIKWPIVFQILYMVKIV
nr:MAG TPA: hypothetical protein [Bacteriophage sp.]